MSWALGRLAARESGGGPGTVGEAAARYPPYSCSRWACDALSAAEVQGQNGVTVWQRYTSGQGNTVRLDVQSRSGQRYTVRPEATRTSEIVAVRPIVYNRSTAVPGAEKGSAPPPELGKRGDK